MRSVLVSSASLFSQTLERDALGRITSAKEQTQGGAHALSYHYDKLGRLKSTTRDGGTTSYGYDANDNRVSVKVGDAKATQATFDAQDRILTQGDVTFEHSPAGHITRRDSSKGSLSLTYDELGNLTEAVVDDDKTITYLIDGLGRRVARQVDGVFDRKWLYRDELRPIAEIDAKGTLTHFVYADAETGAPDFLIRSGVVYRVVKDHLGSVRLLVNAKSGAVAQRLDYDAFGNVLSESGKHFQPFGFAGGLYDADTGLVHFGARDYDPSIGRWTNKDPIGFAGGQTNLYVYVGGDPVNYVDPSGQLGFVAASLVSGAIGAAGGALAYYSTVPAVHRNAWGWSVAASGGFVAGAIAPLAGAIVAVGLASESPILLVGGALTSGAASAAGDVLVRQATHGSEVNYGHALGAAGVAMVCSVGGGIVADVGVYRAPYFEDDVATAITAKVTDTTIDYFGNGINDATSGN